MSCIEFSGINYRGIGCHQFQMTKWWHYSRQTHCFKFYDWSVLEILWLICPWDWSTWYCTNRRERPSLLDLLSEFGLISDGWLGSISPLEIGPMPCGVEGLRPWDWSYSISGHHRWYGTVSHLHHLKKIRHALLRVTFSVWWLWLQPGFSNRGRQAVSVMSQLKKVNGTKTLLAE